jgi:hypothetical protein
MQQLFFWKLFASFRRMDSADGFLMVQVRSISTMNPYRGYTIYHTARGQIKCNKWKRPLPESSGRRSATHLDEHSPDFLSPARPHVHVRAGSSGTVLRS